MGLLAGLCNHYSQNECEKLVEEWHPLSIRGDAKQWEFIKTLILDPHSDILKV